MKKRKFEKIVLIAILIVIAVIGVGCNSDRTADGDVRIEGGAGTLASDGKSKSYSILVTGRNGEALEGATVTLGEEKKQTSQKGMAIFSRPAEASVKLVVTCPNYVGIMYSIYEIKEQGTDTIALQPKDSENHRLKKAVYKNGKYTLDLLNHNKRFYAEGPDVKFNINVEVVGDSDTVSCYEFCQDIIANGEKKTNVIRSSVNGMFENVRVSELSVGTKMYVRVQGKNGLSICTSLNLEKTNKPSFAEEKELKLFGDAFSFEVDEGVPVLGGTQIDMTSFSFPVYAKMTNDEDGNAKVKIGFNIDKKIFNDDEELDELQEILAKEDQANDVLQNREALCEQLKSFQSESRFLAMGGCEFLGKPELVFTGYAEGGFDSYGELSSVSGKISVIVKQKLLDGTWQFVVSTVPLVVQVDGKVEAKGTGGITYDLNKNEFVGDFKIELKPQFTLKGGAGVKGASVGLYGSVNFPIEWIIADPVYKSGFRSIDADAEVGVYGEILVFEAKKKLKNGYYNIWSRNEEADKKQKNSIKSDNDLYDIKNYSPLNTTEDSVIRVQNNADSDTVKNSSTILNESASRGTSPVIASNGIHALSVYTSQQKIGEAENSYSKLYYSVYKNGTWSDGMSVDNNVCNEMNPQIFNYGDNYYIVYQESEFDYSQFDNYEELSDDEKDVLMKSFAKSIDLHIKKYDALSNSFVDYGKIETENEYDYAAEINICNGTPYVYWLKNKNADVFGTNESTETDIAVAKYEYGRWTQNVIITTNKLVTMLEAGKYAGISTCMYTIDEDKTTNTSEDEKTYLYKNGAEELVYEGEIDSIVFAENDNYYVLSGTDIYRCASDGTMSKVAEDVSCFNNSFSITNNKLYYACAADKYSELYVRKKNSEGMFTNPVKITDNQKWIRNMSATMIDGKETLIFLSEDFTSNGEENQISSQILICQPNIYTDISIVGAELTDIEQSVEQGEDAEETTNNVSGSAIDNKDTNVEYGNLSIVVKNNGTEKIDSFVLSIKDASNSPLEIENTDYSRELAAGEKATINIRVKLSETTAYGKWKVDCDVCDEEKMDIARGDNSCEFKAGSSELGVFADLYNSGAYSYLIVQVKNSGRVTDSTKLEIKNANNVEKTFATYNVENLKPGEAHLFKVKIQDSWCDDNGKVALLATIKNSLYDTNVFDDYSYMYATLNYGKYNIKYVLNGGKYNNSISTYTTTSAFKLSNPTREGYDFEGWYRKPDFSADSRVYQITYGSAGDITLYAKWRKYTTTASKTNNVKVTKSTTTTKPGKVKITYIKNQKGKKISAKWKKVSGAKGYQVQYSTNKSFKKKKSKILKASKVTIKKLKKKKTYYFRVRAYKLSGGKKLYGKWSTVKKVKVKK